MCLPRRCFSYYLLTETYSTEMPEMDGLAATESIRQLEHENPANCGTIPIIALSAGAMKGDSERGLTSGMTEYLTKPVNFKLLVDTLENYL